MNELLKARLQPEAMMKAIEDLAARWHRHYKKYHDTKVGSYRAGEEIGSMHAYCKSIAVIMDLPYVEVLESLQDGRL